MIVGQRVEGRVVARAAAGAAEPRLAKERQVLAVARLEAQRDAISRLRRHRRVVEAQSEPRSGCLEASQVTFLHPLQRLTFENRERWPTYGLSSSPSAHCVDVSA